jgi:hypothetical protein
MTRSEVEAKVRQALADRDKRRRERLYDEAHAAAADDAFVAEVVACLARAK